MSPPYAVLGLLLLLITLYLPNAQSRCQCRDGVSASCSGRFTASDIISACPKTSRLQLRYPIRNHVCQYDWDNIISGLPVVCRGASALSYPLSSTGLLDSVFLPRSVCIGFRHRDCQRQCVSEERWWRFKGPCKPAFATCPPRYDNLKKFVKLSIF